MHSTEDTGGSILCPGHFTHRKKIHHYPWIREWMEHKPELDAAVKKKFSEHYCLLGYDTMQQLLGLTSQGMVIFIFTIIITSNPRNNLCSFKGSNFSYPDRS